MIWLHFGELGPFGLGAQGGSLVGGRVGSRGEERQEGRRGRRARGGRLNRNTWGAFAGGAHGGGGAVAGGGEGRVGAAGGAEEMFCLIQVHGGGAVRRPRGSTIGGGVRIVSCGRMCVIELTVAAVARVVGKCFIVFSLPTAPKPTI